MSGSPLFDDAAAALSAASSVSGLRGAIDLWAPRFHEALGEEIVAGPRPELRMEVTAIPGRSGVAAWRGDSFFVGVGSDGRYERRFTLAHELAHAVLGAADDVRAFELAEDDEEDLCELFARRALMPPRMIRQHFAREGVPTTLGDIDRFASRFRVSLRASLVALDEQFPPKWPVAFLAATWRAHPRREHVFGLRVDAAASDRRMLFPVDCRLSTLGYRELEAWAVGAAVGREASGFGPAVEVRSRRPGVSAWTGESAWDARRHLAPASRAEEDRPAALCCLRVADLTPLVRGARPRRPRKREPVTVPHDQLSLRERELLPAPPSGA